MTVRAKGDDIIKGVPSAVFTILDAVNVENFVRGVFADAAATSSTLVLLLVHSLAPNTIRHAPVIVTVELLPECTHRKPMK